VFGEKEFKLVVSPIHPPLGDIKVLSREKEEATAYPEEEEKMLEFFPTNIGKMLVQLFMKNVGSTFCLKNVASTFLLKNVVTFVGKMLPQHFLKKC
jgi:hypothetical protein